MSRQRIDPNTPCREDGCHEPRHVEPNGKLLPQCWKHHQARFAAKNERRKALRSAAVGNKLRLPGRPRPPTVLINEQAGTVQQIVGNLIISETTLPERGLHEATLLILQYRGWRIRYEFAVDETA